MSPLLRRADGDPIEGHGANPVRQWFRGYTSRKCSVGPSEMEEAAGGLRELDERFVPRRGSRRVYLASVRDDDKVSAAHVPNLDETQ